MATKAAVAQAAEQRAADWALYPGQRAAPGRSVRIAQTVRDHGGPNHAKPPGFKWTWRRHKVALCLAETNDTPGYVARRFGVSAWSVEDWLKQPEFQSRVRAYRRQFLQRAAAELARGGIVDRRSRVEALQHRWQRLMGLMEARAEDPSIPEEAGGGTGLVTRQYRQVGKQTLAEYKLDAGLLAELRAHEQQAAQELGEWRPDAQAAPTVSLNVVAWEPREAAPPIIEGQARLLPEAARAEAPP